MPLVVLARENKQVIKTFNVKDMVKLDRPEDWYDSRRGHVMVDARFLRLEDQGTEGHTSGIHTGQPPKAGNATRNLRP